MLCSKVIGQKVKGHAHISNFLYRGVKFSKCSDLIEKSSQIVQWANLVSTDLSCLTMYQWIYHVAYLCISGSVMLPNFESMDLPCCLTFYQWIYNVA